MDRYVTNKRYHPECAFSHFKLRGFSVHEPVGFPIVLFVPRPSTYFFSFLTNSYFSRQGFLLLTCTDQLGEYYVERSAGRTEGRVCLRKTPSFVSLPLRSLFFLGPLLEREGRGGVRSEPTHGLEDVEVRMSSGSPFSRETFVGGFC